MKDLIRQCPLSLFLDPGIRGYVQHRIRSGDQLSVRPLVFSSQEILVRISLIPKKEKTKCISPSRESNSRPTAVSQML